MAETLILAAGTTTATGTDITVPAGASVIVSMFAASGGISESARVDIMLDSTNGADVKFYVLNGAIPTQVITNPTTMDIVLRARRQSQADSVGVLALA